MKTREENMGRRYVIPASTFFFGGPEDSYIHYHGNKKSMKEIFENSKKIPYASVEELKRDLIKTRAPLSRGSSYERTAMLCFDIFTRFDTFDKFYEFFEKWFKNGEQTHCPQSTYAPPLSKAEIGLVLESPESEQITRCYALCAVAVAAVVCLVCTMPMGYAPDDRLDPDKFSLADWKKKSRRCL